MPHHRALRAWLRERGKCRLLDGHGLSLDHSLAPPPRPPPAPRPGTREQGVRNTDTRAPPPLRPHQSEALARAVEELTPRSPAELPAAGLRTQVFIDTGSVKTVVAVRATEQVGRGARTGRVPSLDLLNQTARP